LEKHVERPAAILGATSVMDLGSIPELVAKLIHSARWSVVKLDGFHTERWEAVQLGGLGDAIVIPVSPQLQARVDGIKIADEPIAISALLGTIKYRERRESVRLIRLRLRSVISEDF